MEFSDISAICNYFYGFLMPLNILGVEFKDEEILIERGWNVKFGGLIYAMQKRGFSHLQITTELFTVLIIALIRQYDLSTEPIRQAHAMVREKSEKGLHAEKLDFETRTRCEYELEIISGLEKELGIN